MYLHIVLSIIIAGVRAIAHGLSQNVSCKKLDLKVRNLLKVCSDNEFYIFKYIFQGNNIRASAAEALGRLLRQNSTLLSICLEWNALGMIDSAFGAFCEGLSSNTKLQVLDLRNNQISHDGASDLAAALRRNTSLRVVGKMSSFTLFEKRLLRVSTADCGYFVRLAVEQRGTSWWSFAVECDGVEQNHRQTGARWKQHP